MLLCFALARELSLERAVHAHDFDALRNNLDAFPGNAQDVQ